MSEMEHARRRQSPRQKEKAAYAEEEKLLSGGSNSLLLRELGARELRPMSSVLKERFEPNFNADFSNIRISHGKIPTEFGVEALTRGTDIYLDEEADNDVLGHELAHVIQQASGRVAPGKFPVVENAFLEHEADVLGEKAAAGLTARAGEVMSIAPISTASAPVQAKSKEEKDKEKMLKAEQEKAKSLETTPLLPTSKKEEIVQPVVSAEKVPTLLPDLTKDNDDVAPTPLPDLTKDDDDDIDEGVKEKSKAKAILGLSDEGFEAAKKDEAAVKRKKELRRLLDEEEPGDKAQRLLGLSTQEFVAAKEETSPEDRKAKRLLGLSDKEFSAAKEETHPVDRKAQRLLGLTDKEFSAAKEDAKSSETTSLESAEAVVEAKPKKKLDMDVLKKKAKGNEAAYSDEESEFVLSKFKKDKKQTQYMEEVMTGDFRNFTHMKPALKHAMASKYMKGEISAGKQSFGESLGSLEKSTKTEDVAKRLVKGSEETGEGPQAFNPLLRKGLSMLSRTEDNEEGTGVYGGKKADFFKQLNDNLDTEVIKKTVMPVDERQKKSVEDYYNSDEGDKLTQAEYAATTIKKIGQFAHEPQDKEDALSKHKAASMSMMRTMLAMQLGDFQYKDKSSEGEEETQEWDRDVAVALARGGRTGFILPSVTKDDATSTDQKDSQDVFKSMFGEKNSEDSGVFSRKSTHAVERAEADSDTNEGYKELKTKGILPTDTEQLGMNVAVGGIGNEAVGGEGSKGQRVMNAGRSGHMWMGLNPGDKKHKGAAMVGMESDSAYHMNQTGHVHDMFATKEEASATGAQKTDVVGEGLGGRTVDLSGLNNTELVDIMDKFTQHVSGKMDSGSEEDRAEMERITSALAGKRLSEEELTAFLSSTGMKDEEDLENEKLTDYVNRARKVPAPPPVHEQPEVLEKSAEDAMKNKEKFNALHGITKTPKLKRRNAMIASGKSLL